MDVSIVLRDPSIVKNTDSVIQETSESRRAATHVVQTNVTVVRDRVSVWVELTGTDRSYYRGRRLRVQYDAHLAGLPTFQKDIGEQVANILALEPRKEIGGQTAKIPELAPRPEPIETRLSDIIRPVPYKYDGQPKGFRVYPGRNRSAFQSLGLRPGDLITSIDGVPLTDPDTSMTLFQLLGHKDQVSVTVIRSGAVNRNGDSETLVLDTSAFNRNEGK